MNTPTIFETCHPRADVLQGVISEADFAADLAQVIAGTGSAEYVDPVRFFAHTYPTRGLNPRRVLMALRILLTEARIRRGINDVRNPTAYVADDVGV